MKSYSPEGFAEMQLVRANDIRAGRVVPRWRYWGFYILMLVGFLAYGELVDTFWSLAILFVVLFAYHMLFGGYKQRSIR